MISLAALLGFAVSAPAQLHIEAQLGRNLRAGATVGPTFEHDWNGRRAWREPRAFGYWQTVSEEVLVPGCFQEECVPPRYGWVISRHGRRWWGIVEAGYTRRIWVPAHCETRTRRVFVNC